MALNPYITFTDITHGHLTQMPEAEVQPYIDEANNYYEQLAKDQEVEVEDIAFPVSLKARLMLSYYVCHRFGMDSVGANDPDIETDDFYIDMRDTFNVEYNKMQSEITPKYMTGTATTKESRSTSTGSITRNN